MSASSSSFLRRHHHNQNNEAQQRQQQQQHDGDESVNNNNTETVSNSTNTASSTLYSRVMDKALEKIVPSVMELVDIDGVVRRIDIDDAVQRIDFNRLLQRVDWDVLFDDVDWNRQIERIDFDAIVSRVDIDNIAAQSTTGVLTQMIDSLRLRLVEVDLCLLVMIRYRCNPSIAYLPPAPINSLFDTISSGKHNHYRIPQSRVNKAIAVQGRYCGLFSKGIAISIDVGIVLTSFSLLLIVGDLIITFIDNPYFISIWQQIILLIIREQDEITNNNNNNNEDDDNIVTLQELIENDTLLMPACYAILSFLYFFWTVLLANQTIGMALVGIKVVNVGKISNNTNCFCNGSNYNNNDNHAANNNNTTVVSLLSSLQVLVRTLLIPITLVLLPIPLVFIGLVRYDGRMLHDLVAKTGTVYFWNARMAKLRTKKILQESSRALQQQCLSDDEDEETSTKMYLNSAQHQLNTTFRGGTSSSSSRSSSNRSILKVDSFHTAASGLSSSNYRQQHPTLSEPTTAHYVTFENDKINNNSSGHRNNNMA